MVVNSHDQLMPGKRNFKFGLANKIGGATNFTYKITTLGIPDTRSKLKHQNAQCVHYFRHSHN